MRNIHADELSPDNNITLTIEDGPSHSEWFWNRVGSVAIANLQAALAESTLLIKRFVYMNDDSMQSVNWINTMLLIWALTVLTVYAVSHSMKSLTPRKQLSSPSEPKVSSHQRRLSLLAELKKYDKLSSIEEENE